MNLDPKKPNNDLELLPVKKNIETKKILKKAIDASSALSSFRECSKRLPNQNLFLNTLSLQEAKLSSEVENIVTTNDDLYKAMTENVKNVKDPYMKEVFHYQDALWKGYELVKERQVLTTNIFIELVKIIKENSEGIRKGHGTVIGNPITKEVIYTPPQGEEAIREKLFNLEEYINKDDDVNDLIKLAVIHYQFEAIHPFSDGNGRVGRIINILYLVLKNYLDIPILFLSKYILENKNDYYVKLRNVTINNEWEEWILFMLEAIRQTSISSQQKIEKILNLMDETKKKIKEKAPNVYSKEFLDVLFSQPYVRAKNISAAEIVTEKTARTYLKKLESIQILKSVKCKNSTLYLNLPLLNLLTNEE